MARTVNSKTSYSFVFCDPHSPLASGFSRCWTDGIETEIEKTGALDFQKTAKIIADRIKDPSQDLKIVNKIIGAVVFQTNGQGSEKMTKMYFVESADEILSPESAKILAYQYKNCYSGDGPWANGLRAWGGYMESSIAHYLPRALAFLNQGIQAWNLGVQERHFIPIFKGNYAVDRATGEIYYPPKASEMVPA